MDGIAEELVESLNSTEAFTIPIFGGIPVAGSVVVTWIVMAVLVLLSIIFVRNLKIVPSGPQLVVETIVGFLDNFFTDVLGKKGRKYVPLLGTIALYLALANLIGMFGFVPPTKDINVTAGLSVISIVLIEYANISARGTKGFFRSFIEPIPIILPINILELVIRPLSLCMRLFGNVLGAFIVMKLIEIVLPVGLPMIFSLYFDIFDGLIQTYVFVFLTSLFMQEAMEAPEKKIKKIKKNKLKKAKA